MSLLRRRRAVALVELLMVLIPATILLGLMAMMTADFVTLQRLAGEHAARMATVDSICTRVRDDLVSAGQADWFIAAPGAGTLTLTLPGDLHIAYRIETSRVTRIADGVEDSVWTANRLQFECDAVAGGRGRLLRLALVELPPPRNSLLPSRRFSTTFVLPAGSVDPAGDRP